MTTVVLVGIGQVGPAVSASGLGGSAGTDASLPATPSQLTVSGRGVFSSLQVTVNQTRDLVNQAISVSWKGGRPTFSTQEAGWNGHFNNDYLQMFQCWGAPDSTVPANPGPPPEQCEFGGEADTDFHPYPIDSAGNMSVSRTLSWPTWSNYGPAVQLATSDATRAYLDPDQDFLGQDAVVDPFRAVDGTVVPSSVNHSYKNTIPYNAHDLNPYFNHNETNEIDFTRTSPAGTGQEIFQAETGLEAPGLGCGQQVEAGPSGSASIPQCWLVIVPRGTAAEEDDPADGPALVKEVVDTSPLSATAWRNRIAIPLDFRPVGSSCSFGAQVRRINGSELAASAAASWQPALCNTAGAAGYSYASLPEDRDRALLASATAGGAGLAVFSRPIDPSTVDPSNPVVYAPLTLSGVVVSFNIERVPLTDSNGNILPDEAPFAGERVTKINLTPRLVAKLLTESYAGQFVGMSTPPPAGYSWVVHNPAAMLSDPDFLQYNPEFTELSPPNGRASGNVVVEQSSSDSAFAVWQWILSDPEAKSWLDGQPDQWGMTVNPFYSPGSKINTAEFDKSDPYCAKTNPADIVPGGNVARDLCFLDWAPFVLSMRDAAAATRSTNTGARTVFNPGASSADTAWSADGPQTEGSYSVLSITDSAQAARFGLQTAWLSRAGDDGGSRQFVAPDSAGILAGEQAMQPSAVTGVLQPDPATTRSGAYPLTMLTYAAAFPLTLDETARTDYSRFVAFAAGTGQVSGTAFGDLPPGYVTLPADLQAQAVAAAATILDPASLTAASAEAPPPTAADSEAATTTTTPPSTTTTVQPNSVTSAPAAIPPASSTPVPPDSAGSPSAPSESSQRGAPPSSAVAPPSLAPTTAAPASEQPRAASARTLGVGIGAIRFAVPLGLAAGILAAIAAQLMSYFRRRPTLA